MTENGTPAKPITVSEKRVGEIVEARLQAFGDRVKLWIIIALVAGQGLAATGPGETRVEAAVTRLLAIF